MKRRRACRVAAVIVAAAISVFMLAERLPPLVIVSSDGREMKLDPAEAIAGLSRRLLFRSRWLTNDLKAHLQAKTCLPPANLSSAYTVAASQPASSVSSDSDGLTGSGLPVPNIFHLIRFNQPVVTFVEMLAIKSALRLSPCAVILHCNVHPRGRYWDAIKDDARLVLNYREPPADIFGIQPHWVHHLSDLARLQILRDYGGAYMDNDCIMLRPIDHLRKHLCVVAKSKLEEYMGNMFIVAAPGCRFLARHEELYRTRFDREKWYYNAGELPTIEILNKEPGVAVVVDEGIEMTIIPRLFLRDEPVADLAVEYDVVHTFYNHRYVINDTIDYDVEDYHKFRNTFANIARWLLDNK